MTVIFNCWMVVLGGKEYMLHCGEWFDLSFGETSVPCRLELDRQWYVVMRGFDFICIRKKSIWLRYESEEGSKVDHLLPFLV